jgi:phage baseplate assembly protein W
MDPRFLGNGWGFPIHTNQRGGIGLSEADEKIRQSILIILGTAKGERVMRPDFGCGIHDFVFSVVNASTLTLMTSAVKEALVYHEPRIEVRQVTASTTRLNKGVLEINIEYRVRATNTESNLVYPFYLKDGDQ